MITVNVRRTLTKELFALDIVTLILPDIRLEAKCIHLFVYQEELNHIILLQAVKCFKIHVYLLLFVS